jgi:uncharacterized protein
MMSDEVLEQHIQQYIAAQNGNTVTFTWQGGEPLLAGLDFFKRAIALQQRYAQPGQRIENDLQTNALLLNKNWYPFLKQHRFLLGVSLDGPQHLHDRYRCHPNGNGSFNRLLARIEQLHQHHIPFNILCAVNRHNADHPLETYRFIRDVIRPRAIQFLPVVETEYYNQQPPTTKVTPVTPWSVPAQAWGTFLTTIWQEWLSHDFNRVFVDNFENTIGQVLGFPALNCTTHEFCGKALALEHNGDLFAAIVMFTLHTVWETFYNAPKES